MRTCVEQLRIDAKQAPQQAATLEGKDAYDDLHGAQAHVLQGVRSVAARGVRVGRGPPYIRRRGCPVQ